MRDGTLERQIVDFEGWQANASKEKDMKHHEHKWIALPEHNTLEFLDERFLFARCCGARMRKGRRIYSRQCTVCLRTSRATSGKDFGACDICGGIETVNYPDDF